MFSDVSRLQLQPIQVPNQESNPKQPQQKWLGAVSRLEQKHLFLFQQRRQPYICKLRLTYLPDI